MKNMPEERKAYIAQLKASIKEREQKEKQERQIYEAQEIELRKKKAEIWVQRHHLLLTVISTMLVIAIIGIGLGTCDGLFSKPTIPNISEPAISIGATQLYQEYKNNEIAADLKYKGKTLKVHGIIQSIGEDIWGTPYVIIIGDENDWWGIQCMYPNTNEYRQVLAQLNVGQEVIVTGDCTGYLLHVLLKHK